MKLNHTGHEVYKCARVACHTKKFGFQWFNSFYRPFVFHLYKILYNFLVCNIYTQFEFVCYINALCCIFMIYIYIYIAMSGFKRLVNVQFLLSSLVCLAWVVFSDHSITKSCYHQTKIFAGLLICVLFSHTYSSLHSTQYQCTR